MAGRKPGTAGNTDRADRLLGVIEYVLYFAIATLLVLGAVTVLVGAAGRFLKLGDAPVNATMIDLLDDLLLVFIFVELLFAVRATLENHQIVAEPFLIVGIIASIKEIVVLSVEAAALTAKGPEFARSLAEVGVLGGLVFVLAGAAVLLRLKERQPEEGAGEDERAEERDRAGEGRRNGA
jgi:uncharacterized membrane protein (DUF373 family)